MVKINKRVVGAISLLLIPITIAAILAFNAGKRKNDNKTDQKPPQETKETGSLISKELKQERAEEKQVQTSFYSSTNPLNDLKPLLMKYGRHMDRITNIEKIKLPQKFSETVNGLPIGLYWAYVNELSKKIELDMTPYLGKEAQVYIILLQEKRNNALEEAVCVISGDKIVGCWIKGHTFSGYSLKNNSLGQLLEISWEKWITDKGINSTKKEDSKYLDKNPEAIIRAYFQNLNSNDYKSLLQMYTKFYSRYFLFDGTNLDTTAVPSGVRSNEEFMNAGPIDIKTIKIYGDVERNFAISDPEGIRRELFERRSYSVVTNMTYEEEGRKNTRELIYFITLVKETQDSVWKIDSVGTH